MGLVVGNETNEPLLLQSKEYWEVNAKMAHAFKDAAPDKFTMIAFQNDPALLTYSVDGKKMSQVLKETIDVVGLNIYGGLHETLKKYEITKAGRDSEALAESRRRERILLDEFCPR